MAMRGARALAAAEAALYQPPQSGAFAAAELDGVSEPVGRYLRAAIAPGASLAQTVRLRMRGQIKIGRWLPFRAEQILSPRRGLFWTARVAGVISGFDRYVDGAGSMAWSLAGIVPLVRAAGADVTRSAAGRLASETIWLPTAVLPRPGTRWTSTGPTRISVLHDHGDPRTEVTYRLDGDGHPTSLVFDRWGDPDATGRWAWHRFGGDLTEHRRFGGLTVPAAGRVGWHYNTSRWPAGEFFRFKITDLHPVTTPPEAER